MLTAFERLTLHHQLHLLRAMITCTFRARDLKTKNCLSRTPKVPQKYAQKVRSHWFICP